ncbi:osmoprotection protein [Helicobacter pylori]|nr:osmoprotection protein [Helicobacter pylori]
MGVFKQLIKELYKWLLRSMDMATQHLIAMVVKCPTAKDDWAS